MLEAVNGPVRDRLRSPEHVAPIHSCKDIPPVSSWVLLFAETGRQTLAELILDLGLPEGSQRYIVRLAMLTHEAEETVVIGRPDPSSGLGLPKPEAVGWNLARVKQPLHFLRMLVHR
jgi:hypothetical protein